jgi:hypothetical protein
MHDSLSNGTHTPGNTPNCPQPAAAYTMPSLRSTSIACIQISPMETDLLSSPFQIDFKRSTISVRGLDGDHFYQMEKKDTSRGEWLESRRARKTAPSNCGRISSVIYLNLLKRRQQGKFISSIT